MTRPSPRQSLPRAQRLAERAFSTLERFLHIEAFSGMVLLAAAALALLLANSPLAAHYHAFWHAPLSLGVGAWHFTQSLHFWVNDGLVTIFFLVVGMEIRREIHEGALASMRLAALPLIAAAGGVAVPALLYLLVNGGGAHWQGWAVPTATDIAFAVGVLALLGRSIPGNVRVFLLALAIIDDIAAVITIALFYSGGLDYSGLFVIGAALLMIWAMQSIGIGTAWAYLVPGAVLWLGLLQTGAHPTLAGVMLGLMTPVLPARTRSQPLDSATQALQELRMQLSSSEAPYRFSQSLKQLRLAQRNLLAPVSRVQMALHPWVAYGVMPVFALANAGVSLNGIDLTLDGAQTVMLGTAAALVLGKPLGVIGASFIAVRSGLCSLPPHVTWAGITLVGLLAGIGFTMSIFIATLAFDSAALLDAAKLGVLLASLTAAVGGLAWGVIYARRRG
ncbi:Na+/H+ antiporter NhaA [Oxalicibacterium flavum]|nr:Na+/H+ antiporter NhaA [Oxalicibacterium flavum]